MKTSLVIGFLLCTVSLSYAGDAANGKKIFMKKCKTCHKLTDARKVGPGLKGVTKRRSEEWIHAWIESPRVMIKKKDKTALKIKKKYKITMRTIKAMRSKKNRDDIIAFLKENDG